jgi:UDP-N-acetylmuramoyl-L-alanyl-D-glutamate--2,6-diaminopimelate ligase
MRLRELADGIPGARWVGPGDAEVLRAVHDSRRVRPGDLFVAVLGTKVDGHRFLPTALAAGAAAVIVERLDGPPLPVPALVVADAREALALAAHALAGHPTRRLKVCGVTGTSGKTTTTYLVRRVFEQAGWPTGLLGTVAYDTGRRQIESDMTTPDAGDLAGYFAEMVEAGLKAAVMEVSSHALDQRRTAGIRFDVAAFTNLSPEHRDYHPHLCDYARAKGRLFESLEAGARAVLSTDDATSLYFEQITRAPVLWYGLGRGADVTAEDVRLGLEGSRFTLVTPRGRAEARTLLLGRHNVQNCLTAAAVGEALGLELETIAAGLGALPLVRGRLEAVPSDRPFTILVDYAHKTDALQHCLGTVRNLVTGGGRVIAVFGCGGNRDREKRPDMARVAEALADRVIVTSDNPRHESPQAIADEIVGGFGSLAKVTVELDRRAAIALAIAEARPGDAVVIAGKGHETYQITGDVKRPFDDREVAAELLRTVAVSKPV